MSLDEGGDVVTVGFIFLQQEVEVRFQCAC